MHKQRGMGLEMGKLAPELFLLAILEMDSETADGADPEAGTRNGVLFHAGVPVVSFHQRLLGDTEIYVNKSHVYSLDKDEMAKIGKAIDHLKEDFVEGQVTSTDVDLETFVSQMSNMFRTLFNKVERIATRDGIPGKSTKDRGKYDPEHCDNCPSKDTCEDFGYPETHLRKRYEVSDGIDPATPTDIGDLAREKFLEKLKAGPVPTDDLPKVYKATLDQLAFKPISKAGMIAMLQHVFDISIEDERMFQALVSNLRYAEVSDMPGHYIDTNEYEFEDEPYNNGGPVPVTTSDPIEDGDYDRADNIQDPERYEAILKEVKAKLPFPNVSP